MRAIDRGNLLNEAVTTATSYVSFNVTRTTKVLEFIHMKERDNRETPQIINVLNENLKRDAPEEMKDFTVEGIAQKIGISKNILYEWAQTDPEFSSALERIKTVQSEDPFKTGTIEDSRVNAMVIAFVLLETRDRHYKPGNI